MRAAFIGTLGSANVAAMSPRRRTLMHGVRVLRTVFREVRDGQLSLRAMGLVYTTLLSLVPLLAVSFSVLKAFGVHNQLEGTLLGLLLPLGEQGIRITDRIVGFVENMNVRALGSLGLALLIYTVVSLVQKIDGAVNRTWRIRTPRGAVDRFSRYLSVILVGPVLVFSAMGIGASLMGSETMQQLMAVEPFGEVIRFFVSLLPYILVIAAFSFVYAYIPNTRVYLGAALAGGIVAGLLWATAGWAFAAFIVGSTSKWTAVYSSLAILMVFMVWLYVGWMILLVGASVSFYTQNPHYIGVTTDELQLGNRVSEQVGLQVMRIVAQRFVTGATPLRQAKLAAELKVPIDFLREITGKLVSHGLLTAVSARETAFVPAKDLQNITVLEILTALRAPGAEAEISADAVPSDSAVADVMKSLDEAYHLVGHSITLRELAVSDTVDDDERVAQDDFDNEASAEASELADAEAGNSSVASRRIGS